MNGSSWLDHTFDNYQVVEQDATAVVQRGILNFTGAVVVTDNPANGSTDVAVSGASVPTGTGFWHLTGGASDAAAKLVVNADVSASAAIDVSKLGPGSNGDFLTVVGGVPTWDSAPTSGITQLTGDVTAGPGSGSVAATVAKANGASVPAAGALTTGNVLQVTGVSALSYGPVNLAGGANYVTGTLPTGNQAAQTMAGDVTGTTAASVVTQMQGGVVTVDAATGVITITGGASGGVARIGGRVSAPSTAALYLFDHSTVPNSSNYNMLGNGSSLEINAPGGTLSFEISTTAFASLNTSAFFFGSNPSGAAPVYVQFSAPTTPVLGSGSSATSLTVGTGKAGASLVLQGDNATTVLTLSTIGKFSTDFATSGTVASAGRLRADKDFTLQARNAGNSADVPMVAISSDNVYLGNNNGGNAWGVLNATNSLEAFTAGKMSFQSDNEIGFNGLVGGIPANGTNVNASNLRLQFTSISVTAGDVTASAAQAACVIITATGTPGGVNTIVLPDLEGSVYIVVNSTGSGANVRFAKVSGGGVSVAVNKTQMIRHNGTDYVLVTTAA